VAEPGFTIEVVVAGQVVRVETSAEVATRNVTDAMGRPRSGIFGGDPKSLTDRAALHVALSTLAANILLHGEQVIRTMQDTDGRWWSFRGGHVGAVAVIDNSTDQRRSVGFQLEGD
jgi:hypothetical protein